MSQHLPILPILLPLLMATLMLLPPLASTIWRQRVTGLASSATLVIVSILLLRESISGSMVYAVGDWQPPFGIILVADRLAALMVLLTSVLAFGALLFAVAGDDNRGKYFHSLFMFQLMGVNGAFLTGDIFNLFVFFEVLLIASYALLIHGSTKTKTPAAVHYVTLNLIGSAFFLFALGILYATMGTLNMADLANKAGQLDDGSVILAKIGVLLLLLVFGLKAAILPLHFWLPRTYAAASPPVAALFTIMTKVGIYAIYRIHIVVFGADAGQLAFVATPWIWPMAILTVLIGGVGVLAAPSLRILVANLVLISVGTLLFAIVMLSEQALIAGLYYLVHTTLVTGALFLLADLISTQRGQAADRFVVSRPMAQAPLLGFLFFVAAITVVGLPPLSGFIGKALLMQAAETTVQISWIWPTILISSLAALIAMSRAGTNLFWHLSGNKPNKDKAAPVQIAAIVFLLSASPLMVIFGGPITGFTERVSEQMRSVYPTVQQMIEGAEQ